jgi:transcriptional regulator with XRE-family HTH domain
VQQSRPPNPAIQATSKRATSFEPKAAAAFGAVVRDERVKLGVAQDQFALIANVDRSYFGKLERGERQPSLALILRIAGGLQMPAAELVSKVERFLQKSR